MRTEIFFSPWCDAQLRSKHTSSRSEKLQGRSRAAQSCKAPLLTAVAAYWPCRIYNPADSCAPSRCSRTQKRLLYGYSGPGDFTTRLLPCVIASTAFGLTRAHRSRKRELCRNDFVFYNARVLNGAWSAKKRRRHRQPSNGALHKAFHSAGRSIEQARTLRSSASRPSAPVHQRRGNGAEGRRPMSEIRIVVGRNEKDETNRSHSTALASIAKKGVLAGKIAKPFDNVRQGQNVAGVQMNINVIAYTTHK